MSDLARAEPSTGVHRLLAPAPSVAILLAALAMGAAPPQGPAAPAAPATGTTPPVATQTEEVAFAPLDVPDFVILENKKDAAALPWILVIDDAQCPYCMQLHLALEKARDQGDAEITRAVVATLPFPLAIHDQAAHIVMDAFCLEDSGPAQGWSAASYLDWLMIAPWRSDPGWKGATLADLEKDGGFFDTGYEARKVISSARRRFQTEKARADAACTPETCRGDGDCAAFCRTLEECRGACPRAAMEGGQGSGGEPAASAPAEREKCLSGCGDQFVSKRYRQLARAHVACLLRQGPGSAHARTAASFDWAVSHGVPGTPTVYAGHPSVGFHRIGDAGRLSDFMGKLRAALARARGRMEPASKTC